MAIPFSPRAALCTAAVLCGFAALAAGDLPAGLGGFRGLDREGNLPIVRGGGVAPDAQRAILEAVLRYEARRPGRSQACLQLAPEGAALASEKREIAVLEQAVRSDPSRRAPALARLEALRNPARRWLRPSAARGEPEAVPLDPQGVRQLRTIETALVTTPGETRVELMLNMSALPAGFRSAAPGCDRLLFTAPAVAGDVAFVEIAYRPQAARSENWFYALVLREGQWEIEALAPS